MGKRKIYLDEKTWEDYVSIRPELFLGEDLELRSRQEIQRSGRLDLTFWDKDRRLVLVEIQLKALDRDHFFRMIEYHKDLEDQGHQNIRIILLCNEVNPKRDYVAEYRNQLNLDIKVITMSKRLVEKTILDIDPSVVFSFGPIREPSPSQPEEEKVTISRSVYDELTERFVKAHREAEQFSSKLATLKKVAFKDAVIDFERLIWKAHKIDDHSGIDGWYTELYDSIFDKLSTKKVLDWEEAYCPLCGEGTYFGGHLTGWKIPNGFMMHLKGTHNVRQCIVMKAVTDQVRDHFRQLKRKKDIDRAKVNYAEYVARRSEEKLYKLHPFDYIHLYDEKFSYREPNDWQYDFTFSELSEGIARSLKTWDFAIDR